MSNKSYLSLSSLPLSLRKCGIHANEYLTYLLINPKNQECIFKCYQCKLDENLKFSDLIFLKDLESSNIQSQKLNIFGHWPLVTDTFLDQQIDEVDKMTRSSIYSDKNIQDVFSNCRKQMVDILFQIQQSLSKEGERLYNQVKAALKEFNSYPSDIQQELIRIANNYNYYETNKISDRIIELITKEKSNAQSKKEEIINQIQKFQQRQHQIEYELPNQIKEKILSNLTDMNNQLEENIKNTKFNQNNSEKAKNSSFVDVIKRFTFSRLNQTSDKFKQQIDILMQKNKKYLDNIFIDAKDVETETQRIEEIESLNKKEFEELQQIINDFLLQKQKKNYQKQNGNDQQFQQSQFLKSNSTTGEVNGEGQEKVALKKNSASNEVFEESKEGFSVAEKKVKGNTNLYENRSINNPKEVELLNLSKSKIEKNDNQKMPNEQISQSQAIVEAKKSSNDKSTSQQFPYQREVKEDSKFQYSLNSSTLKQAISQPNTSNSDQNFQNQQSFVSSKITNPQSQNETEEIYNLINKTYSRDNTPFFQDPTTVDIILTEEYSGNQKSYSEVEKLFKDHNIGFLSKIRGDGNCFFRSFFISYLLTKITSMKDIAQELPEFITALQNIPIVYPTQAEAVFGEGIKIERIVIVSLQYFKQMMNNLIGSACILMDLVNCFNQAVFDFAMQVISKSLIVHATKVIIQKEIQPIQLYIDFDKILSSVQPLNSENGSTEIFGILATYLQTELVIFKCTNDGKKNLDTFLPCEGLPLSPLMLPLTAQGTYNQLALWFKVGHYYLVYTREQSLSLFPEEVQNQANQ